MSGEPFTPLQLAGLMRDQLQLLKEPYISFWLDDVTPTAVTALVRVSGKRYKVTIEEQQ